MDAWHGVSKDVEHCMIIENILRDHPLEVNQHYLEKSSVALVGLNMKCCDPPPMCYLHTRNDHANLAIPNNAWLDQVL